MKQFLFLAVIVTAFSQISSAAPCASGSLSTYIGLGAAGCTIGTNTVFDFQSLSGTAGATPIAATDVTITPFSGSYSLGLTAATSKTATAGMQLESLFTYQLTGSSYSGSSTTLANSSETPDGAVTDIQNYCAGGTFGPDGVSGCSGVAGTLVTLDGTQNQDSQTFSSVALLSVTDDFTVDGGQMGSASGGSFTDQFTATPEPSTFLLIGLVFAVVLTLKFRSAGANLFKR